MDIIKLLHTFYVNIGNLAVICLLINVVLLLYKFNRLESPFQRFCYFLIWSLLIEVFARIGSYMWGNNLPLLHLYTLGEFILLSWFYKTLIMKPAGFQSKYWSFIIGISGLIILNSLLLQSIDGFNTYAKTFVQIIIISYAILYFYNLTENQSESSIVEKILRLINSAIIVYYSGSLFIFMCGQISFDISELYIPFWAFNASLYLIFQLLILWGIWKVVFKKTPFSS